MDQSTVTPGPAALRALSHPLRLRLLALLRLEGPATATSLAARTGTSSGATSYHLRQLAAHGFVEDTAGEVEDGRTRWWRSVHRSTHTDTPHAPDEVEAVGGFAQAIAVVHAEQLQRAVEEYTLLPAPWREASTLSDWIPRLRPEQARALTQQIIELVGAVEDDDHPDARPFSVRLHAHPWPGSVTDS